MPRPPIPAGKPKSSGNLAGRIVLICVAAFIAFMAFRVFQFLQYRKDHPTNPTPGYVELKEATKKTVGKSNGIANGNTPAAQSLAEKLSQNLGVLR